MSMEAYSMCAYGLYVYPRSELDLELKNDISEFVDKYGSIYEYVFQ